MLVCSGIIGSLLLRLFWVFEVFWLFFYFIAADVLGAEEGSICELFVEFKLRLVILESFFINDEFLFDLELSEFKDEEGPNEELVTFPYSGRALICWLTRFTPSSINFMFKISIYSSQRRTTTDA